MTAAAPTTSGLRIISLEASNVKRLKAVKFKPDPLVNVVAGDNGEGKTSLMDSILYALGGKKALCAKPVREGEDEAVITLEFGDFIVSRTIKDNGRDYLTVKTKDGKTYGSPQTMLDKMMSQIAFDPAEWLRWSSMKKRDQLLAVAPLGISYDDNREQHKRKYDERRDVGRDVKRTKAAMDEMGDLEKLPEGLRPLSEVMEDANRANQLTRDICAADGEIGTLQFSVEELEGKLVAARSKLGELTASRSSMEEPKGTAELQEEMDAVQRAQTLTAAHARKKQAHEDFDGYNATHERLSAELSDLDADLERALRQADMPVEGLSVSATDVLMNGLPLNQASQAEQLRVSLAIAAKVQTGDADNPKLRVVRILDGSLLDDKSMDLVREFAEENDCQVWIERIEKEGATIIMEAGEATVTN